MRRTAEANPEKQALDFLGRRMSYGQLWEETRRFARALQDLGVQPGDRVAIMLPNTPQFIIAFYGALLAGAVQFQRVGPEELDDVETLFVEGMQERMFGLQEIVIAVRLWRDFKRRASPTYRKPEVYAAAVEYIMILLGFYKGSQTGVGKDYGVSAATVASKYKEIEQRLGIYQYDERYSIHEDPSAPFRAMWKELGVKGPPKIPLGAGRPGKGFDMRLW